MLNTRQKAIIEYLAGHKYATVTKLSEVLFFSASTIRRDLTKLEEEKYVLRTHGGATLATGNGAEIPIAYREETNRAAKCAIGRYAAKLINSGETIFMDSSSTVAHMTAYMEHLKNVTVITNGAQTALDLGELHSFKVICTGGYLRENSLSYVGMFGEKCLSNVHVDKMFFSSRAIDIENGASEINEEETKLRQIILGRSTTSYYLAEAGKFGKTAPYRICGVDEINTVITDSTLENAGIWTGIDIVVCNLQDK